MLKHQVEATVMSWNFHCDFQLPRIKWVAVYSTGSIFLKMPGFTVFHRFLSNVHANSSSPCPATIDLHNTEGQPQPSMSFSGGVLADGPAVIPRELSAQIKHVTPLLHSPAKHAHTPLIQARELFKVSSSGGRLCSY
ncbi:hypothetical protein OSTOST_02248 [Ostertagia ostertagi]